MFKLLDRELLPSGCESAFHYDHESDTMVFETVQDVLPYIENNKANYNRSDAFTRWKPEMVEVADIPNVVVEQWLREDPPLNIFKNDPETRKEVRRRLNSPEWRYLRTTPGRI
jgi:hypothetical protein